MAQHKSLQDAGIFEVLLRILFDDHDLEDTQLRPGNWRTESYRGKDSLIRIGQRFDAVALKENTRRKIVKSNDDS